MTRRDTVHNELTQDQRRQVLRDTLHGRAVAEQGRAWCNRPNGDGAIATNRRTNRWQVETELAARLEAEAKTGR